MGKGILNKAVLFVLGACLLGAAPVYAQGTGPGLVKSLMLKTREAAMQRASLCRVQAMKSVSYWKGPNVGLYQLESDAVLRSVKEIVRAASTRTDVTEELRSQAAEFEKALRGLTPDEAHLFFDSYAFLLTDTEFALKNNRWLLRILPYYKHQLEFIKQNRKKITSSLQISKGSKPGMYARAIAQNARVILLGELHDRPNIEREIALLLQEYRQQYPNRKMVLFTEFLPDELPGGWDPGHRVPAVYLAGEDGCVKEPLRRAALLGMDVYGLENYSFIYEEVPAAAGTKEGNYSFLAMHTRNKHWHDLIVSVMAHVRRTDPDAVFFVYAGNDHIDKSVASSVAAMLEDESPFSVKFSDGFQDGFLGFLLGKKPQRLAGLPERHLLRWAPDRPSYAQRIGFDLQVIVPWELPHKTD